MKAAGFDKERTLLFQLGPPRRQGFNRDAQLFDFIIDFCDPRVFAALTWRSNKRQNGRCCVYVGIERHAPPSRPHSSPGNRRNQDRIFQIEANYFALKPSQESI